MGLVIGTWMFGIYAGFLLMKLREFEVNMMAAAGSSVKLSWFDRLKAQIKEDMGM